MRSLAIRFCLLAPVEAVSAASCAPGQEIWAREGEDRITTVVYFPVGTGWSRPVIFEGWKGADIQWRVKGEEVCSNGVVFCFATIPMMDGQPIEAAIDTIYENDEPKYLVFSQLAGLTFRQQAYGDVTEIDAEWFVPKPTGSDGPDIVLPTSYRFIGCQKGDELEAERK